MYASAATPHVGVTGAKGSFIVESPVGWQVYLGGAYDANPRAKGLMKLREVLNLTQKYQLHPATIDLRYGLHPVFTLRL